MNAHTLMIEALDRPAMMERLLRTTRHRGFQLRQLQLQAVDNSDCVKIRLTVTGDRPLELLTRQLTKLADIHALTVQQPQAQRLTITA